MIAAALRIFRNPTQAHEAWRTGRTLSHGEDCASTHFGEGIFIKHLHFQPGQSSLLRGAHGKLLWAQIVGRHLHERARQVDAVSRDNTVIYCRLFAGGQENHFLHRPFLLLLVTARAMGAVTNTLGDQPRRSIIGQQQRHRPALGLGRLAHGLTSGSKPMARHRRLTQSQQEQSLHGSFGHTMNERAIAGLAAPFAALDQFTQQPTQARIEHGIRHGAGSEGDGQGVHLQFLPVSGMYRDVHKFIFYRAPAPSPRWRAAGRSRPADTVP